jgi:RND family efflux transporter MFP subunit
MSECFSNFHRHPALTSRLLRGAAVLGVFGLVHGAAVTPATAQQAQPETPEAAAALTVEATRLKTEMWLDAVEVSGKLAPWQEVIIASEVAGPRIVELNAEVGQTVKKGDVLARLAVDDIETQIVQQEAQLASAQASLVEARQNAARVRSLSAGNAVSQKQVDEAVVSEARAEAEVKAAEAALAISRLNLSRTAVVALDDGIITARSANLGAVVSLGTELFRLLRQGKVEWQVELPLRQLRRVQEGTKAEIITPSGRSVPGTVRLISPEAAQTTGRVTVYVTLDPPANAPQPKVGMLVTGRLVFGESEAKTLPSTAIVMRDGRAYVYVLGEANRVERRRVELGRRSDDRVEVLSGVTSDEKIVAAGGAFHSDGATVRVVEGAQK